MKTLVALLGVLWCSQAGAETFSPLAFPNEKFELPPFGLLDAAKQKLPSILGSAANSRAHAETSLAARRRIVSRMPVVAPKSDVDTRMPIKTPDDTVEFKLTVKTPEVDSAK